jgi:hypothetical protein
MPDPEPSPPGAASDPADRPSPAPTGSAVETGAIPPAAAPEAADPRRARQRLLLWLAVAGLLGSLATVPYAAHLMAKMPAGRGGATLPPALLAVALVFQVAFTFGLAFGLAWVGVALGERIGLADPILGGWAAGRGVDRALLRRIAVRSLAAGIAGGAAVTAVLARAPMAVQPGVTAPSAWEGLLGSVGAGITEEMLCRLGLLTLFAWAGARLLREERPGEAVFWTANVLAGLAFAALHLPQANALLVHVDARVVGVVLGGNLAIGLLCGWLYRRFGILAAMIAHFGADLVLHVVPPLLKLT